MHHASIVMLRQIDAIFDAAGIYRHAFLYGQADNYQPDIRTVTVGGKARQVPFIVCGSGRHNVNVLIGHGKPSNDRGFGIDVSYLDKAPAFDTSGLRLEKYNDASYGYLRIDATKEHLGIGFHVADSPTVAQSRFDNVTGNLADFSLTSN